MDDSQLLRYSRQIMLPQIDIAGQQTLLDARVLIIGLGGLGSPAALYLAAAGVGTLVLSDDDVVDLSNLQRQIAHQSDRIGLGKVTSAELSLRAINPDVTLVPRPYRLTGAALIDEVRDSDVVLDCSDNFTTRFAVNEACVRTRTPLVSGAVIRFEAQLAVFNPAQADSPCYHCLFPDQTGDQEEGCARTGVLAPLPGVIGSLQAVEAIKLLLGIGRHSWGRLLLLDALTMEWQTVRLRRHPRCPCCGSHPDAQQGNISREDRTKSA